MHARAARFPRPGCFCYFCRYCSISDALTQTTSFYLPLRVYIKNAASVLHLPIVKPYVQHKPVDKEKDYGNHDNYANPNGDLAALLWRGIIHLAFAPFWLARCQCHHTGSGRIYLVAILPNTNQPTQLRRCRLNLAMTCLHPVSDLYESCQE
jgi:hypothetical protein